MAVKTFTQGEKLTYTDTNTYLNNGGLVYITETSFTTSNSIIVDNCFTSTYANYRIMLDLSASAADANVSWQWRTGGSSGSTYTTGDYDQQFTQGYSTVLQTVPLMGQTYVDLGYVYANTGFYGATIDVFNPQAAFRPNVICHSTSTSGTGHVLWRVSTTSNRVTTAFTGIRLSNTTNVNMTGRVRIYGYRQS